MTDPDPPVPAAGQDSSNTLAYEGGPDLRAEVVATDIALESLRATRPWMLFVAVMLSIGVGFAMLGGLGMLVASAFAMVQGEDDVLFFLPLALLYLGFATWWLLVTLRLYRTASSVGRLLRNRDPAELENLLEQNRQFWRGVGVLTIAFIITYIAVILIMALVGLLA